MSEKRKISWGSWIGLAGLIVIAAAVAIPMYGDYTDRSQVAEAAILASAARMPLAEYFANNKKWPESLDKLDVTRKGKYTESVTISRGAGGSGEIELTATMQPTAHRHVAGKSLRYSSKDGGRTWACTPGTIAMKYVPVSCRPDAK